MRITCLIILSTLLSLNSFCQAKYFKDKTEVETYCAKFMDNISRYKIEDAIMSMKEYSVIESADIDKLSEMAIEQFKGVEGKYGKTISFELMEEKQIRNTLMKRSYLLKFEKSCLKFDFVFYNNGKGWALTNFNYAAEIEGFVK
jgi:hypothetical protein